MEVIDSIKRMRPRVVRRSVTLALRLGALPSLFRSVGTQVKPSRTKSSFSDVTKSSKILQQIINFGLIVATALMIWNGLKIVTGSESPIVVVLSGSMEPAFYRGDLLFLTMSDTPVEVGEIVVYKLHGRDIPIVHRIMQTHEREDGTVDLLTKGDNNRMDDRQLYNVGQDWLQPEDIIGRAQGLLPKVGMVTIIMNDYPSLKFLLIGLLGIFVIANREN